MIFAPTNRRIIRPYDKPSFEHTQRYGLIRGHWANRNRAGLWLFNEGSGNTVQDLSGNGYNGTLMNSTTWRAGKFGSALSFNDVTDDYISTNLPWTTLRPIGGNCTLSMWINRGTSGNGYYAIFGGTTSQQQCLFYYSGNSTIYFKIGNTQMSKVFTINAGTWYHIVAIVKNTVGEIFVNGVSLGTGTVNANTTANNFIIGQQEADVGTYNYNGLIDNAMAYNRALSASEIALLYREPFLGIEKRTAPVYFFVPTVGEVKELAGAVAIESTVTGALKVGAWIGIESSHYDSHCGDSSGHDLLEALDVVDYWEHDTTETHWFILDLGQTYTVQKVRGRSYLALDPIDVNIYVNNTGEAPWGDAVASGIDTWQDTTEWQEVDVTEKEGRYVKVEIIETEDPQFLNRIGWGAIDDFAIFDVYGEVVVGIKELAGTSAISSVTSGKLGKIVPLAGTTVISSTTAGELSKTAEKELAGTVVIGSTTSGVVRATRELAGTVTIASTATGDLVSPTRAFAGTVAIGSTTTGELTTTGLKGLAGEVAIASITSGTLKRLRRLAGIVAIESIVLGELEAPAPDTLCHKLGSTPGNLNRKHVADLGKNMAVEGSLEVHENMYANRFFQEANGGWTGTFTNADDDTVTVKGGIITGVA